MRLSPNHSPLTRPATVLAAGLAAVAFAGCGGGDETLSYGLTCHDGAVPEVVEVDQILNANLWLSCRDAKGNLRPLDSAETAEEVKYDTVKPNFKLSVKVNANGNAIDYWLAEPLLGFPDATFQPVAGTSETDMKITGIQELKAVTISRVPSK